MQTSNPKILLLNRLYEQCQNLDIPFPFNYKILLSRPDEIDVRRCQDLLILNLGNTRAKPVDGSVKPKNFIRKKKNKHKSAKKVKREFVSILENKIGVKKSKKKKRGRKRKRKETQRDKPWSRIIYVGSMWRS